MTQFRTDPFLRMVKQPDDAVFPPEITPKDGGGKFTPKGELLEWPGNTMICHIPKDSDAHAALVDIQDALKAGPHANAFAFLPQTSLHMTIFQGISGPNAAQGNWPSGVDMSATRDDVSEILLSRLEGIKIPATRHVRALDLYAGHSMTMDGIGADEEALRETRRILKETTGMSQAGFETYTFHITLAYQIRWLTPDEAREIVKLSDDIFARHGDRLQSIELGQVEFCNFENMFHFEPLKYL